jgi:hypothetical protein
MPTGDDDLEGEKFELKDKIDDLTKVHEKQVFLSTLI